MQFIVLNENKEPEVFAIVYARPGLCGESQKLTLGSYRSQQLVLKEVASIEIAPDCTCIFYENADGTGQTAATDGVLQDFAELPFIPHVFLLLPHVSCIKNGKVVQRFFAGTYPVELLQNYDEIRIPKMNRITWDDAQKVSLTNGTFHSSELPNDAKNFCVTVEGVIRESAEGEMTHEELLQVAAGAEENTRSGQLDQCYIQGCEAQVCAADTCAIQACPSNACITNVIPVVGLI